MSHNHPTSVIPCFECGKSEISLHLSFIELNPRLMTKYKKQPQPPDVCEELRGCWTAQCHKPLP